MTDPYIWLLMEERPHPRPLLKLLTILSEKGCRVVFDGTQVEVLPVMKGKLFTYEYVLSGVEVNKNPVRIRIVKGISSFVDCLVYEKFEAPTEKDTPLLVVEITKTSPYESRNTSVAQRATKFAIAIIRFPDSQMVYLIDSAKAPINKKLPESYVWSARALATLGVKTLSDQGQFPPFISVEEFLESKNKIKSPPKGNVATEIIPINENLIKICARLNKNETLSHDPNIGFVSLAASVLRKLGYGGKIVISNHQLPSDHVFTGRSKIESVADTYKFVFDGIQTVPVKKQELYWKLDFEQEKHATIFMAVAAALSANSTVIYENHGGTERGYLVVPGIQEPITIPKKDAQDRTISIPDCAILLGDTLIIAEGKTYKNRNQGIAQLKGLDPFIDFIKPFFPSVKEYQTGLVLGGSGKEANVLQIPELLFYLQPSGRVVFGQLGAKCGLPEMFSFGGENI